MRKYGVENFHIELIQEYTTLEDMISGEAHYCEVYDAYNNGYNMTTAGEINPMECSKSKYSHDIKMRSSEVRNKISMKMKQIRADSKNYIYVHKDKKMKRIDPSLFDNYQKEGWEKGAIKGKVKLHNMSGKETSVFPEYVNDYLTNGWIIGGKPNILTEEHKLKLKESHKNISDKFRREQSARLKKYYEDNPDYKTKSKKKVRITNPITAETKCFNSCSDLCKQSDIPEWSARSGAVGGWVKLGYINYKKSMYNNWKIEFTNENDKKEGDNI